MKNSPHYPPVHPKGALKLTFGILVLLGTSLALIGYWYLYERVPSRASLVAKAERYVAEWRDFKDKSTLCQVLKPIGGSEKAYAKAYVGCRHEGMKAGYFHVLTWHSVKDRGLSGRPFAMQIDGGNRWTR